MIDINCFSLYHAHCAVSLLIRRVRTVK